MASHMLMASRMVVLLLSLPVVARAELWERIASCHYDGPDLSEDYFKWDEDINTIKTKAAAAKRVRICTTSDKGAYGLDCVTSKPDSFVIKNFREGMTWVTYVANGDEDPVSCDQTCVTDAWDEDSVSRRATNLYAICDDNGDQFHADATDRDGFGWACGNGNGIHAIGDHPGITRIRCGWTAGGFGKLSMYFDSGTTTVTTSTATTYTSSTHTFPEVVQNLAGRLLNVEVKVGDNGVALDQLNSAVPDLTTQVDTLESKVNTLIKEDITSLTVASNTHNEAIVDHGTRLTALEDKLDSLVAALGKLTSVSGSANMLKERDCSSDADACTAGIQSVEPDGVRVSAPGDVTVSASCGEVNVCTLASMINEMKNAIGDLSKDD